MYLEGKKQFRPPKNFGIKKNFCPKRLNHQKNFNPQNNSGMEPKLIFSNELEFYIEHRFSLNFGKNENFEEIHFSPKKEIFHYKRKSFCYNEIIRGKIE